MLEYKVQIVDDNELMLDAYELAKQFKLPRTYDAQYLALAQRLNCEFWTVDQVLVNTVSMRMNSVRWLGDFRP